MTYSITTKLLITSKAKRVFHGLANADLVRMQLNTKHERPPLRKLRVFYDTVAELQLQLNDMNSAHDTMDSMGK